MSRQVEYRFGTTAETATFTGGNAEMTVDITKKTLVVHDGTTAGGFPLAREDLSNVKNYVGATATVAGAKGVVPAPAAGDQAKLLQGDGTWILRPDEVTVVVKSNTAETLVASDQNCYLRFTNVAAKTFTVPTNATVPFPIGTTISGISVTAARLTITGASGVTINTPETLLLRAKAFVSFVITKVGTDVWDLAGDLEAA